MKLVLGIDPGSITTGYGLVGEYQGNLVCRSYGILGGNSKLSFSKRLVSIGEGLAEILRQHQPAAVVVEKTFYAKNVDSVTKLSHARGVCVYEVAKANIPIFEYLPTEIKASVVGYGKAGKDQVEFVVRGLLGLQPMEKFDMSDALALAIHHVRIASTQEKLTKREINL